MNDCHGSSLNPKIVDTVLAKLYAMSEKTPALYTLLSSPSSTIIVSELEDVLQRTGQYNALVMLHRLHGDGDQREKILGVLAK